MVAAFGDLYVSCPWEVNLNDMEFGYFLGDLFMLHTRIIAATSVQTIPSQSPLLEISEQTQSLEQFYPKN